MSDPTKQTLAVIGIVVFVALVIAMISQDHKPAAYSVKTIPAKVIEPVAVPPNVKVILPAPKPTAVRPCDPAKDYGCGAWLRKNGKWEKM